MVRHVHGRLPHIPVSLKPALRKGEHVMGGPVAWFVAAIIAGIAASVTLPAQVLSAVAPGSFVLAVILFCKKSPYPDGGFRGIVALCMGVFAITVSISYLALH